MEMDIPQENEYYDHKLYLTGYSIGEIIKELDEEILSTTARSTGIKELFITFLATKSVLVMLSFLSQITQLIHI